MRLFPIRPTIGEGTVNRQDCESQRSHQRKWFNDWLHDFDGIAVANASEERWPGFRFDGLLRSIKGG